MFTKPKTKQENQWHSAVAEFAMESSWLFKTYSAHCRSYRDFELHHIAGAQTKVKHDGESVKIGEFFIIPIPAELHHIRSNHPLNVTIRKNAFESAVGAQTDLFVGMVESMIDLGYAALPSRLIDAIKSY